MKEGVEILRQQVIVDDAYIIELKDREYAESLSRSGGVMLHFGISYAKMPYSRHYRCRLGELWEFSSIPFPNAVSRRRKMKIYQGMPIKTAPKWQSRLVRIFGKTVHREPGFLFKKWRGCVWVYDIKVADVAIQHTSHQFRHLQKQIPKEEVK